MRAFTYVVASDSGFAPNPYHGWCTLACCKPRIRAAAEPGDLVVGLSRGCATVVYAMRVGARLTFAEYWADPRFAKKRPAWRSRNPIERLGDNLYAPDTSGHYAQQPSVHWDHAQGRTDERHRRRDLSVETVLVADEFVYFGGEGPRLPDGLEFARVGRAHRCNFDAPQLGALLQYFDGQPRGVMGPPGSWLFGAPPPLVHVQHVQPPHGKTKASGH